MDLNGFDARKHEDDTPDFEPLPPGWYQVAIVESEEKETAKGDGSYLKLKFQVIEGPREGKNLWANLNLNNPSEKAVKIARGQLSAICSACADASGDVSKLTPTSSQDLHMIPLEVKVAHRTWEGKIQEDIKAYRPLQGKKPAMPKASAPSAFSDDAPARKSTPWD